jgi:hypothetical protein
MFRMYYPNLYTSLSEMEDMLRHPIQRVEMYDTIHPLIHMILYDRYSIHNVTKYHRSY